MQFYVTLFLAAAVVRLGWMVAGAVLEPVAGLARELWDDMEQVTQYRVVMSLALAGVVALLVLLGWALGGGGR